VRELHPDWLLFPVSRSNLHDAPNQQRWDEEEEQVYIERARQTGTSMLMVNHINDADGSFGGAWVFGDGGRKLAGMPLRRPGILLVDTPEAGGDADAIKLPV
jgi:hypothetical protein